MILVDRQIAELCEGFVPEDIQAFYSNLGIDLPGTIRPMVEPFTPDLVNPASLDVTVGNGAMVLWYDTYEQINLDLGDYWVMPGQQVLVGTAETFYLPRFLTAQFKLKSSRAREWWQHGFAGFCDPGWNSSVLTMELYNHSKAKQKLFKGQKIGQMIFSLTFGLPRNCYGKTGRYNGDKTVEASKE